MKQRYLIRKRTLDDEVKTAIMRKVEEEKYIFRRVESSNYLYKKTRQLQACVPFLPRFVSSSAPSSATVHATPYSSPQSHAGLTPPPLASYRYHSSQRPLIDAIVVKKTFGGSAELIKKNLTKEKKKYNHRPHDML